MSLIQNNFWLCFNLGPIIVISVNSRVLGGGCSTRVLGGWRSKVCKFDPAIVLAVSIRKLGR